MGVFTQTVCLITIAFGRSSGTNHHFSGFRSSFDRGCMSLWFHFRRNVSFSLTSSDCKYSAPTVLSQVVLWNVFVLEVNQCKVIVLRVAFLTYVIIIYNSHK